jgi:hypothetical protein
MIYRFIRGSKVRVLAASAKAPERSAFPTKYDPELAAKLFGFGQVVEKNLGTPASFVEFIRKETDIWGKALKAAKIEPE